MLEVITQYWVLWLCGLLAGAVIYVVKRWTKLERENMVNDRHQEISAMRKEIVDKLEGEIAVEVKKSNESDLQIRADLEVLENGLDNLTRGILSLQGAIFKQECRRLLESGHVITLEEYEQCVEDHEAYNGLGGNNRGDSLFSSVEIKWKNQLTE